MENSNYQELLAELSPKRQRFVQEYLVDLNATQAAIRAGYSEKTAQEQSAQLLSILMVKAAVDAGSEEMARKLEITVDRLLEEEKAVAFSDIRQLFGKGTTISPDELPEEVARAVAAFEAKSREIIDNNGQVVETVTTYKYRLWDKGRALERLGKYMGLYEKDNRQRFQDNRTVEELSNEELLKIAAQGQEQPQPTEIQTN